MAAGAETEAFSCDQFAADKLGDYDAAAFGCLTMGDEALEETESEPFFGECKSRLDGKKIALFGSCGWGEGEWMRSWEDTCREAGAVLACESVICADALDDEAQAACEALGKALV